MEGNGKVSQDVKLSALELTIGQGPPVLATSGGIRVHVVRDSASSKCVGGCQGGGGDSVHLSKLDIKLTEILSQTAFKALKQPAS